MAWLHVPSTPTPFGRYDRYVQLWRAVRERVAVTGNTWRWPEGNIPWYEGTISGLSADVLTDSAQTWPHSWHGWVQPPGDEHLPDFYTVVINPDAADPWDVIIVDVRAAQTGNDLPIEDITDHVTAGWIPSLASLVGKPYAIISGPTTSPGFGYWWPERWPTYPNDREDWKGTVDSGTTTTLTEINASIGTNAGRPQAWSVNQWAGKDLLVGGSDGRLHRVAIVSNTADTLTYAAQAWTPTGNYVIVAAGGRAWPGRARPDDLLDYGGYSKSWYSNHPNDTLAGTSIAAASITIEEYNAVSLACEASSVPIFDVGNFWTRQDPPGNCEPYDKLWTPNYYKALRGIQLELETLAPSFIEKKSYSGATEIPNFSLARWFKTADINWGTSSVAGPDGAGDYHFTVSSTYYSVTIHWEIRGAVDGRVLASGSNAADSAGKVIVGTSALLSGGNVVYSAGWSRPVPRMVRFMFERTGFIPDVDAGVAVDPPEVLDFAGSGSTGVGQWIIRPASTAYAEYDKYGSLDDTGGPFVAGEVARFVGDSWMDGGVGDFARQVGSGSTADLDYYHNFAVAVHPAAAQATIDAQESGTASAGSTTSLTDTAQNWWTDWYGGGELHVESGVATGGSSTSLTDSTKNITLEAGQFFIPGRFAGFDPYVGFIVEVQDEAQTWHKRPIAGCTFAGNVPTITWSEALAFDASGRPWRIREPAYELNRWRGRKIHVTKPDGTRYTAVVTHSDDETLWFSPVSGLTVEPGDSYQIFDPKPGTTWKRRSAAGGEVLDRWEEPSGADPRGVDWRTPSNNNQPTVVPRYGKLQRHDYAYALIVWQELYRATNAQRWTKSGGTYYDRATPGGPPEVNWNTVFIEDGFRTPPDDSDEVAAANSAWIASTGGTGATVPYAFTRKSMDEEFVSIWMEKAFAYFEPDLGSTLLTRKSQVYIYSGVVFVQSGGVVGTEMTVVDDQTPPVLETVEFNADGTGALYHKNAAVGSEFDVAAGATSIGRVLVGDSDITDAPDFGRAMEVPEDDPMRRDDVSAGWSPLVTTVINQWDVPGGLTYVD